MQFIPKTEDVLKAESEERKKANLWNAGNYPFEVVDFITFGTENFQTMDTYSKKGNEMIQLALRVYNFEGSFIHIKDYLVASLEFKLRHAAAACNLLAEYEQGQLHAFDFIGKKGELKLAIQKGQQKHDGSLYPDKNIVQDCIIPESNVSLTNDNLDDEIPFK
jgi:hypothetical protein